MKATPPAARQDKGATMFKHLSIFAALLAVQPFTAQAQQLEAVLHRMEVPGANFEIIVARPSSSGATIDLGRSPEALVIHLIGGGLALSFDSEERMLKTLDSLQLPACAFHAERTGGASREPVAVYVVPRSRPTVPTR